MYKRQLDITCLPSDLPEFIEIDLSKIELDQTIHAKDITLPKGVELSLHVEQENPALVAAREPKIKSEPEATGAPEAPAAPTATKLKDKE